MKLVFYQGKDSQWYWRLTATNGKKIADGAEGYKTRANVIKALQRLYRDLPSTFEAIVEVARDD